MTEIGPPTAPGLREPDLPRTMKVRPKALRTGFTTGACSAAAAKAAAVLLRDGTAPSSVEVGFPYHLLLASALARVRERKRPAVAMHFYAESTTRQFELAVDNPGHGEVFIRTLSDDTWSVTLYGANVGRLLTEITALALGEDRNTSTQTVVPAEITAADARALLTQVQHAVLLAGAGGRYDHLMPDPDSPPPDPLCSRCDAGSPYSDTTTDSTYCVVYGHQPFGFGDDATWDQAITRAGSQQLWWQARKNLGLPD